MNHGTGLVAMRSAWNVPLNDCDAHNEDQDPTHHVDLILKTTRFELSSLQIGYLLLNM